MVESIVYEYSNDQNTKIINWKSEFLTERMEEQWWLNWETTRVNQLRVNSAQNPKSNSVLHQTRNKLFSNGLVISFFMMRTENLFVSKRKTQLERKQLIATSLNRNWYHELCLENKIHQFVTGISVTEYLVKFQTRNRTWCAWMKIKNYSENCSIFNSLNAEGGSFWAFQTDP